MKTTTKLFCASIAGVLFSIFLSAFMAVPGGDSFTIYLNDKLVVKQYVHLNEKVPTISLAHASSKDVLRIHYSHCGKIGVARNLTIKDEQNKTLRSWKFENSSDGESGAMTLQPAALAALQKSNVGKTLSINYSSEQLPEGKLLVFISSDNNIKASIK